MSTTRRPFAPMVLTAPSSASRPRDDGNLGARGCKPLRDGEPDPLASAGDHRRTAGETDIHSYPPLAPDHRARRLNVLQPRARRGKPPGTAAPRGMVERGSRRAAAGARGRLV